MGMSLGLWIMIEVDEGWPVKFQKGLGSKGNGGDWFGIQGASV